MAEQLPSSSQVIEYSPLECNLSTIRTVIEFNNKGDKLSELFKDRPIGILDLQIHWLLQSELPEINCNGRRKI